MEYKLFTPDLQEFPKPIRPWLQKGKVYDCSCSRIARTMFIDEGEGFYLKKAPKGTLEKEAAMTRWYAEKNLAAPVEIYLSDEEDWLLKRNVKGQDLTDKRYLSQPEKLVDFYAESLWILHSMDPTLCPDQHYRDTYRGVIEKRYIEIKRQPETWEQEMFSTVDEAKRYVDENLPYLKDDVVIHGDYCLPNVIADDWKFSGFIDLGNSGVFDRHVDIYWALWSLSFNLKTDRYRDRFIDVYGRSKVDEEALKVVAACENFG